ncbi:hypothetical protein LCGC14_0386280 [marine sediment metagenome]|uniref:Uncharacterized protein n=1 Tax=marine sediment metagenome TaxID=412755 RepID=A0A0F9T6S1_9ZZZZ
MMKLTGMSIRMMSRFYSQLTGYGNRAFGEPEGDAEPNWGLGVDTVLPPLS